MSITIDYDQLSVYRFTTSGVDVGLSIIPYEQVDPCRVRHNPIAIPSALGSDPVQ